VQYSNTDTDDDIDVDTEVELVSRVQSEVFPTLDRLVVEFGCEGRTTTNQTHENHHHHQCHFVDSSLHEPREQMEREQSV
jgi:predicted nucleotidyltransferase component of viral defense system